jgi:cytochrome c-type biogenesis protein CcmF
VFSEWISGSRISVGAPFFNKVMIPTGLLLLILTGVGPLLAWRKTSPDSLKRNFAIPLITGVVAAVVFFALGYRDIYSLVCFMLCFFVAMTVVMEFYRGARVIMTRSGASLIASAIELTMRNTRRYGGYIVHMGMVLVFIGLAGAAFNKDVQKDMQLGSSMQIGRYTLILQTYDIRAEKNYTSQRMIVEVLEGQKEVMMLYPEKRQFPTAEQPGTMVAIHSTLREDLYVVFAGINPDTNIPVIHAYLNPLVKWIWFGGVIVVFGTVVALLPNRRDVLVLAGAGAKEPASALGHAMSPTVTLREGHD